MSFSVYEIVVPAMLQGLRVLEDYLDYAQKWESQNDLNAGLLLTERLAPDMLVLGEQFSVTCDKIERHVAQLRKATAPKLGPIVMTYGGLKARLDDTRSLLEKIDPAELAGAQSHTYELNPPVAQGYYDGDDYIRFLVLPDFYFHIATVHAILRHVGIPVGKRDYLGHFTPTGGGYS